MKFEPKNYNVKELVDAYNAGSLIRNPEYQRGAAWSRQQKQSLVDSIFRDYPLPPLFLEVKQRAGLGGTIAEQYEIIDGQQRILSLVEYLRDDYLLLSPSDSKLRLPLSLREASAPWAEKRFSELTDDLRQKLSNRSVDVYLARDVENSDEVRDLFIRLQSGTALTRQQIRDAWPGEIGPRVERWAGKLSKHPKYSFFNAVDGRGTRDDEDDSNDSYVKHRTTCAQLCTLLLGRAENPFVAPSIKAADLDALYHRYTRTEPKNNPLENIEGIFDEIQDIVERIELKSHGRRKVPKITLFALAMFLQDAHRSTQFKLTTEAKSKLAYEITEPKVEQNSRASSGGVIRDYYERWRAAIPQGIGIELDAKRLFDEVDSRLISDRQAGLCANCHERVLEEDAEYDHFPVPYRDGGRTVPENGRLVHGACHPRGRPVEE